MAITRADVEHVALLSRLELTEAEKDRYAAEISEILAYVDQLAGLDVTGVPATTHALPTRNVFREDVARPSLPNKEVLANAPEAEDGCFRLPRIVQGS